MGQPQDSLMTFDTLDHLSLDDRASLAIETLDSFELGTVNQLKANERTIRDQGFGASAGAQAIVKKYLAETTENVKLHHAASQVGRQGEGVKDLMEVLGTMEPELVALVGLQLGLETVANGQTLSQSFFTLGQAIETEVWAHALKTYDKKLAARLEKLGKKRGSMANRKQAVRSIAAKNGFESGPWTHPQRILAGKWLVEVLCMGSIFLRMNVDEMGAQTHSYLTITEDALAHSEAITKALLVAHPIPLPLLTPPTPWADTKMTIDCNGKGYDIPLLRRLDRVTQAHLKEAHKAGQLTDVYAALNAIQGVAWSINPTVLEMIRWAFENNVKVEGLPPKMDYDIAKALKDQGMPETLTDDEYAALSEDQKRLRRTIISKTKENNRSLIGERMTLSRDLAVSDILTEKGNTFWTPYNMDYRGRVYSVCHFGFQRQDYVRALFMFKEGKPLGTDGLYWLKVHLANCGDFGKVSKKPFPQRIQWVEDNMQRLLDLADDPKLDLWWTEADAPFLFLAACVELGKAWYETKGRPEAYVCHLPVSFDGSCSGLQHFAAMTRCQDTAELVNVAPTDVPQDVYQTVADKTKVVIEDVVEAGTEDAIVANLILTYGVNRSLVKRNVMTYSYSSPKFGMITQQMEDTMRPLADKVIRGELSVHPLEVPTDRVVNEETGQVSHMPGRTAAKFLGSIVFDTIEATVKKPAEAMTFLQGIARGLAHEAKPVIWKTPLGLPVVLRCLEADTKQVAMYLSDKGVKVRVKTRYNEDTTAIDKRAAANAIAPSFVHSMDACHLQMVSLRAANEGITNMALVHDSFGCLPCDAGRYRQVIKEEFHRMYSENDVLADIHASACEQIDTNYHRIPALPEKGSLDINEVLNAEYAFA